MVDSSPLTLRQQASRVAHIWKAVTQDHHQALAPVLRPCIPLDGVVFDVGAHAGQFTKLFASLAPQGRVFAFEPSRYARGILSEVVRLRSLAMVEIVPAALGARQESLALSTPLKTGGSLGFGLAHLGKAEGAARLETVPVWTLDAFFARRLLARLDFIKADIEGFEGRLLAGAAETLARFRPALLLEFDASRLARAGDEPAQIFAQLAALGYQAQRLGPNSQPEPIGDPAAAGDFLFTRAP